MQRRAPSRVRDLVMLTKPEITLMVVMSALGGFLLGSPAGLDGWTLFWLLLGVGLTSAGACALNHVFEAELDAKMHRTANRPVASGRISPEFATQFSLVLGMAGIGLLCPLTNPLTATLALLTVALYLYVYTPLKQTTPLNTLVGTIPGAVPALGGYAAATGTLGAAGWVFFGVLALWQMPHFLSLAWMYRKDYARGGFRMSPTTDQTGVRTGIEMALYTVVLIGLSLWPFLSGWAGWVYGVSALVLGAYFLAPIAQFFRDRSAPQAKRILKASVYYLMLLVLALVVDYVVG